MSAVLICPERAQRLLVLKSPHRRTCTPCPYPLSSHKLSLSPQLCIIWLHNTMSVSCSSNTSMPCLHSCLSNAAVSHLAELKQFLVPCVNCDLSMPLPVAVWGTLLSGVGDARQLEQLSVKILGQRVSTVWTLIFAVLNFRGLRTFAFFAFWTDDEHLHIRNDLISRITISISTVQHARVRFSRFYFRGCASHNIILNI